MMVAGGIAHTQDDAFITFRYSAHLVDGHGPVWNPGEAVEGYSNFLWMLIMAIPMWLGFDPVLSSWLLSLACMGGNIWLSFRLFSDFLAKPREAFLATLLLVTNFTFLAFGTSGLETSLNALIWTSGLRFVVYLLRKSPQEVPVWHWFSLGILYAFAVLSRPDGLLLPMLSAPFILLHLKRHKLFKIKIITIVSTSFACLIFPWLAWKWHFYGQLLPNTFYAKGSGLQLRRGALYLGWFAMSYLLVLPAGLALLRWRKSFSRISLPAIFLMSLVGAWFCYLLSIGGDFMEFRMLVPILPVIYLGVAWQLFRGTTSPLLRYGAWGCLLLANLAHGPTFAHWYHPQGIYPVRLKAPASSAQLSYAAQGKALRTYFGNAPDLHLAIGGAGAVPYYSRYRFTDIMGLTDPITAREGIPVNLGAGHDRLATLSHLKGRGVHFLILRCDPRSNSHLLPELLGQDVTLKAMLAHEPAKWHLRRLELILVPITQEFVLSGVYLNPHPKIEVFFQKSEIQRITF